MAKETPRTKLTFKGVEYPFYRTVRGNYDHENAGFTLADMAAGKLSAQYAYLYFQLRDCARRAGKPFEYSLDDFIDQADGEELLEVFERLNAEKKRLDALEKTKDQANTKVEEEASGEA